MTTVRRMIAAIAALYGLTSVMLGAALDHVIGESDAAIATAERYQQVYAAVILAVAFAPLGRMGLVAAWLFIAGLAAFCGSIYAAHLLDIPAALYATPVGGTVLMAAWVATLVACLRRTP